ncbi:MAG: hypothetical protein AB8I08_21140 [Sandaracinaceae bacterium]
MSLPIKSRHGLTRCSVCRTHIQAADRPSDTNCPFCGANLHRGGARITHAATRGGVLAASLLAFSLTACGGGDEPADEDPSTQTDNSGGETPGGDDQYSDDPADDPNGVAEYGVSPDQYSEDPAEEPNVVAEYGVSPDDEYEEEPADEMRPSARYGMAPMR